MTRLRNTTYNSTPDMYASGLSIQDIADYCSISRQSMYMILKRRGVTFRQRVKKGAENHFHRGGATMSKRSQHLVEKAIKKGALVNPGICSACRQPSTFKDGRSGIQAHHDDYNKPVDVRWLCQSCHHEWHKTNKAKEVNSESRLEKIDLLTGGFPIKTLSTVQCSRK